MSDQGSSSLQVTVVDGGWAIEGEIDAHTAARLAASLSEPPAGEIVVADFGGVTFMDSSGLRVLVEATARAADEGRQLVISRPSPAVRRVVEISGLIDTLHLRD